MGLGSSVRSTQSRPDQIFGKDRVACGCAGHGARKMSSRSQLSHRTYGGSPHWLLDHHQRVPYVLHNRCGRRYHRVKVTASNGASGNGWVQENPSVALLFDRRLLQQNLPGPDGCAELGNACSSI